VCRSGQQKRRPRPRSGTPTRYTNTDTLDTNNRGTSNRTTDDDVVTLNSRDYDDAPSVTVGCFTYCSADDDVVVDVVVVVVYATSTPTSRPSVTRPGRL